MVDFAKSVPYHWDPGYWNESALQFVEDHLAEAPCYAGRSFNDVIVPKHKAPDLLRDRWLANTPLHPTAGTRGA
jgi:hypothetical protein